MHHMSSLIYEPLNKEKNLFKLFYRFVDNLIAFYVFFHATVVIETIHDQEKKTQNIPSAFLNESSNHENFVVEVTQPWTGTAKLALFLDCHPLGLLTLNKSPRDMLHKIKPPLVRAVRKES